MKNEYKFLNYFNIHSFFLGIGLSKILSSTKEMYFITIILGTLMGLLILKLFDIWIEKRLPNIIILSIYFVISLMVLSNMLSSMYLTEMPKIMVGIPIIIVIIYVLKQKEIVIFKISNIIILTNILLFIISIVALGSYVRIINFSYSNTNINNVIISSLEYALLSTTPLYVLRDKKFKDISITKTYILTSLELLILFTLTLGILGSDMVGVYRYPEYIILKRITLFNNSANMENIICFYWIFNVLMFLITCANRMKDIIGFKYSSILIILLLLITGYFNSDYKYIIFIYKYTYIVFGISLLLLCFINKKRIKE